MKLTFHDIQFGLLVAFIFLLSSCASPLLNIGRSGFPEQQLDITTVAGKEHTWQTSELVIKYTIDDRSESLTISGSVTILGRVLNSYPVARTLTVYINLLNGDGVATSMADLGLVVPFYSQISRPMTFRKQLSKEADTTSFSFSYWGTFVESSGGDCEELEIFHNPF